MQIIVDGANRTRVILANRTELFVSYKTCVAARLPDGTKLRTEKVWSRTTSKMIGEWRMTDAEKRPQEFFDNLMQGV
jgi:hypothetical protein